MSLWEWLFRRRQRQEDLDEEVRSHLRMAAEERLEQGESVEQARVSALREFGNVGLVKEVTRDMWGWRWLENLLQDLRYAARMLRKSPGFTAAAVLTLALSIGANTAIFSALNAVLLRSLPVHNPHELRLINWVGLNPHLNSYTGTGMSEIPGGYEMGTSFPYPAYRDFRDHGTGFADVFAFFPIDTGVTAVAHGEASIAGSLLVSGNFFSGYGVSTLIGRPILPKDDKPGAAPVAVITYRWWERHFGLDPSVVGQTVTLNKTSFTVVGVLSRHYVGPMLGDPIDIYVPISAQPQLVPSRPLDSPNSWWVQIMGRLVPGVNEAQAQASLAVLFQRGLTASDTKMDRPGILLQEGSRGPMMLRQRMAIPFLALTGLVGLVLMIACANLAGLLLVRGNARQHEMAVRTAVGAGRWRLIRQSLTESLVLSLIGGGLGLFVAAWGKRLLLGVLALAPEGFHFDLRTDSNVLVFTLGVSVLTALFFGLLPAFRISRVDPLAALKGQSAMRAPRLRLGKVLIVLQVGLSVLLVIVAGLMVQTFANLRRLDPGFDAENVLLFRIDPGHAGYDGQRLVAFYDHMRSAIEAIPGVRSAAFSDFALVSYYFSSGNIEIPGREKNPSENRRVAVLVVSEDFFRTMSIPLLLGREFSTADTATAPPVAVVNETFARRYFPGQHSTGQMFLMQDGPGRVFHIVGVCRDAKYDQMRTDVPPLIYLSQRQRATDGVCFEVRSALPPLALVPAVRKALAVLDFDLPLSGIKTQEQQIEQSIAAERVFASLGSTMGLLAVLLSCIGLYGLMAHNVVRRTGEIGVRMALGATPWQIAAPILREAAVLTTIGLAAGVPVALTLARLIKSQLYGVAPTDLTTLIGSSLLLITVGIVSAWIPARRAMGINLTEALRYE